MKRLVLAAVVACGGSDHGTPDGSGSADASVDAAPTSGMVTAHVASDNAGVAGVTVVFQAPDGSEIATATTDANGEASATVTAGGTVTIIRDDGANKHLRSYVAVKPGDRLELATFSQTMQTISVTFPADPAASSYDVHVLCGGNGVKSTLATTVSGLVVRRCFTAADVLVLSRNNNTGQFLNALLAPNVTIADGQSVTVTGSYTPVAMESFALTNAMAFMASGLQLDGLQVTAHGFYPHTMTTPPITNGNASFSSLSPKATDPAIRDAVITTGTVSGDTISIVDISAPATSYSLDVDTALPPLIASTPAFDLASHTLSWTQTGNTTAPDAARSEITVMRGASTWIWDVVAPYDAGTLVFPALPGASMTFNPVVGDIIGVGPLQLAAAPGGYDAVRADYFTPSPDGLAAFGLHVDGSTVGRVLFEQH